VGTSLELRKLADYSKGERNEDGSWPLLGVTLGRDATPPESHAFSTTFVADGISQGWISIKNPRPIQVQGGSQSYLFVACDEITLHLVEGDLVYRVVTNPGVVEDGSEIGFTIVNAYTVELESFKKKRKGR
jgi:hypothetical protein